MSSQEDPGKEDFSSSPSNRRERAEELFVPSLLTAVQRLSLSLSVVCSGSRPNSAPIRSLPFQEKAP